MNNRKRILKSTISLLLILSLIISPFTSSRNAKASSNSVGEVNQVATVASSSGTTLSSVSGRADNVIQNPFIGDGYEVKFNIASQWQGAYNGSISITNTGNKTIENWELSFESQDNITNIWNAVIASHEGNKYKIKNAGWNQDIEPGKTVSFGFGASFTKEVSTPSNYRMLGEVQQVSEEKCKVTYSTSSRWDTGYVMEVTITNLSDTPIEDWKIVFDLGHEITNIWNGTIISRQSGRYDIKNSGYNAHIKVGGSVSFGFMASVSDKSLSLLPVNVVLKQVIENNGDESDDESDEEIAQNWNQKMIHADTDSVIAARNQVNGVVKVALIDSGVDFSTETNIAVRKNFIAGYSEEELNPMYDDLSGHGTAVAALIASNSSQQTQDGDDPTTDEGSGEDSQQEDYDFSYLTEQDRVTLTPALDDALVKFLADQGEVMHERVDEAKNDETTVSDEIDVEAGEEATEEKTATEIEWDELMSLPPIEGINPNVEIYSARVLDDNNEAPVSRVIEAIEWAIEQKVNIINISWGIDVDNSELHAVISKAYQNGILIIAAAGNGQNIQYPARYPEVMAVGSIKCNGDKADNSATGEELEVVAPGQDVVSYGPFGIPVTFSGTSMAAPQVTGLASLLWQKDLTKSNEFIRQLIDATAKNLGDKDIYGYGLIDCDYAIGQYDNFAATFNTVEKNVDRITGDGTLEENNAVVDTYSEAVVKGNWDSALHKELVNKMKIVREGAVWSDNTESGFKGMTSNPGFHGYYQYEEEDEKEPCDYIAAYIYLTEQAVSFYHDGKPTDDYSVKNEAGIEKMHTQFIECIEKAWENKKYKEYSNEQKALFIYGLSLHTVGDIFTHSTYAYQTYKFEVNDNGEISLENNVLWSKNVHGPRTSDGKYISNSADSKKVFKDRFASAKEITKSIISNRVNQDWFIENKDKIKDKMDDEKDDKKDGEKNTKKLGTIYDFKCTKYQNINTVDDTSDAKKKYLETAYGIVKYKQYISDKITDREKYKDYIASIEGVTNANIKKVVENWSKVDVTISSSVPCNSNNSEIKVYKVDSKNKRKLYKTVKSGKSFTIYLDENQKYILVVNAGKKTTSKRSDSISTFAISDTANRYVCTKEIMVMKDNQTRYIENKNYQTMCLGTKLILEEFDFLTASLSGAITIADNDLDDSNDEVLPNARISLTDYNDNSYQITSTSDEHGKYEFVDLVPGVYTMLIQKEGYIDIQYIVIIYSNEDNIYNPVIAMISQDYDGIGNASGNVVDAVSGDGVEGLTLRFRKGLNVTKDTVLMETKTGEDGSYTAENLTIGYYTVQIVDEREVDETEKYPDGSMTVRILGGYTLEHQNGIVEKNVEGEPLQIVLIWTDTDRELRTGVSVYTKDAEYITSFGFDNYSLIIDQDKQYNIMDNSLDIEVGKRYSFRIYGDFHWIDDYDEFSNYGAYVIIIYNGKKITLEAPAICGNVWNIIEIDGRTKEIKIINTVDAICNM